MDATKRILALLDERGIKAAQLTKELSLSHGVVSQWKQGLQKPSTEAIIKVAEFFNVTTDFLLTGKETPNYINTVGVISGNENVVSNHGTIIRNGSEKVLSDDIAELLRIAEYLEPKRRHRLLSSAFELEEEQQSKE